MNCVYGTKLRANASWGEMRVDSAFLALYHELGGDLRFGELNPEVRVTWSRGRRVSGVWRELRGKASSRARLEKEYAFQ